MVKIKNKKNNSPMPVGIIFIVIGLIVFYAIIVTLLRLNGNNMLKIDGTIIGYESGIINGKIQTYAVYEYEINGKIYTYTDLSGTKNTNERGKIVQLYYDTQRDNVESAEQVGDLLICSLIFVLSGTIIIIYSKRCNKYKE